MVRDLVHGHAVMLIVVFMVVPMKLSVQPSVPSGALWPGLCFSGGSGKASQRTVLASSAATVPWSCSISPCR